MSDFIEFIRKYNVLGLGLGVVIGTAAKDLVTAVVSDVFMPIIGLFLPGGTWRESVISVGAADIAVGHLIGAALDFILIAWVIYALMKYILRIEKVEKL